ncbi:MAG TPA: hypothetical protein VGP18_03780 [Solirubrobacteraceae bacterium]|jgi:hypothetical protein|nr:hypothetical protein [Solirubrobacteraceae bacterium]
MKARSVKVVRASSCGALLLTVLAVVICVLASSACAEGLSPWWSATSGSRPSVLSPGGEGVIVATAQNRGDASTTGIVTVQDTLPAGVEAVGIKAVAGTGGGIINRGPVSCKLATLTCKFGEYERENSNKEKEIVQESLRPFEEIEVEISVALSGSVSGGNTVTVTGGGAAHLASSSRALDIGGSEHFGFEDYELLPEEVGGSIDTQAGSHPFQLTSVVTFNQLAEQESTPAHPTEVPTAGLLKDVVAELPVGLFGNPTPFAQCTDEQFGKKSLAAGEEDHIINECPAASAIGVATITFSEPAGSGRDTAVVPIFNMKPLPGEPARFGFKVLGIISTYLDTSVRTGGDYGVTISVNNLTQIASILSAKLTFWGVPGDPRHNNQRGWECLDEFGTCPATVATSPPPFLVMPTSCEAPYRTTVHGDSWNSFELPAETAEPVTYTLPEGVDGCNHLPFSPSISVAPDIPDASTPTGLTVGVHVSQQAALNPEGLAESTLRDTTVMLPEGVTLNPAGADGLEACAEGQVGYTGVEEGEPARDLFTNTLLEPFCPNASKIGTVTIKTPLLPNPLEGAVYLATQDQNPFGSLVAMYLVAQDPVSGTLIKLAGEVKPDPVTGQIVSTFKNTPELPFEDLELHFFGGERAPLATPAHCGTYTTNATFTPWSGNESATPSSSFQITSGPNGTPCPGAGLPFGPSLTAGTTSIQAGGFSPFTMTMSREDGQQSLQAVSLHMPPGISGLLSSVKLCGEAQANAGTCGPESEIGETIVSVGLGGEPFSVKGGKVFITEGYEGAPFGLSIVNPAKAGPFDLEKGTPCDCVVVRAKIAVDPITAQLTVTTDTSGPYKIPTILDGIPLQIQHINVTVNRPKFTFNPTNCEPTKITGTISSTQGGAATIDVPYQATNCAVLAFKPAFSVSTSGQTSRSAGASLHVKLAYPSNSLGKDANVAKVKVDLPKQLPSRLSTLQLACTLVQFEANPAGCPGPSIVGHAKATTPLVPVPLEGPAYFVSNGGAKFPELVIVLQGYGLTIDLHGETFISRANITSSTFSAVPDQPIGSFELTLPEGKYSALAANGELCKSKLAMPTAFVAQNGAEIHESTPISVTGCKASVSIVRHSVKGATVTIAATVPSAGKLVAGGAGLSRVVKHPGKAGTVSFSLKLSARERALLRRHPGRKLQATVKLVFTPAHGQKLTAGVSVNVG